MLNHMVNSRFQASIVPKLRQFYVCTFLPELANHYINSMDCLEMIFHDYNFHLFINKTEL